MTTTLETPEFLPDQEYISLPVPQELWEATLPDVELPPGYGVIGGAARNIAWEIVRQEESPPLRDIDLVALADRHPDMTQADELAAHYNPDDYKHGHGVQTIKDLHEYFGSRDFTVNEVVVVDGQLSATKQALDDIKAGVIRPAEAKAPEGRSSDKIALKALLLQSVLRSEGHDAVVEGIYYADLYADRHVSDDFSLALFLQKSLEYGGKAADTFWTELSLRGMLDDELQQTSSYRQMAEVLDGRLNRSFEYHASAQAMLEMAVHESEFAWSSNAVFDEIERWRDYLPTYAGHGAKYVEPE